MTKRKESWRGRFDSLVDFSLIWAGEPYHITCVCVTFIAHSFLRPISGTWLDSLPASSGLFSDPFFYLPIHLSHIILTHLFQTLIVNIFAPFISATTYHNISVTDSVLINGVRERGVLVRASGRLGKEYGSTGSLLAATYAMVLGYSYRRRDEEREHLCYERAFTLGKRGMWADGWAGGGIISLFFQLLQK
ncbi:hypothetical protein F5Y03DRAFT_356115 [Xylaria venustula]|nr:hypothetical protein F5Y03DRAFT_356115 [Xylaria venustula]